jgi:integrase
MPGINKLAATKVARITKRGRYGDGAGLWLSVSKEGAKSWVFQFTLNGKERQHGMGSLTTLSLADARIRARKLRQDVEQGIDPIAQKRAARFALVVNASKRLTFEEAAKDYIDTHEAGWKNEKHRAQWTASLETYAFPVIGKVDVADITTAHILAILKPIWAKKSETATRVRGRIKSILDSCKAAGYRSGDNPAAWDGHLEQLLPKPSKVRVVRPMPAMAYTDMPAFMRELSQKQGISARALEILILTVSRSGALIGMRDEELDLDQKIWVCPADRMKGGKEHSVPLCDKAEEILKALPREKNNPYLFAGARPGTSLSNMSMLALMRGMSLSSVPHGFRSSFCDWASETTNAAHTTIEMALAHTIGSKTERAYRRGDLFEKRRALMTEWAAYLYPAKQ